MVEGVGDTKTGGEGDKHKVAPVVRRDGANVEGSLAMSRPSAESWTTTSCPGGWMGWEAKLWGERSRPCQAETEGSSEKERKWLRVNSACGMRRCHQSGGKEM